MPQARQIELPDAEDTARRARELGRALAPGATILLTGTVGAGKTHFARHLISSLLDVPEDIPSPTFTLVQTYDTQRGPLWHSDLYRLSSPFEIEELGLLEAFDTAICLVEWPDRLGDLAPNDALRLTLREGPDCSARTLDAQWGASKWAGKTAGWRV
jgi:tRNA threonylcarbamoyladenosine biosynthesis protein TsaE